MTKLKTLLNMEKQIHEFESNFANIRIDQINDAKFKNYLDTLKDVAIETDIKGKIIYANPFCEKAFSKPLAYIIDNPITSLFKLDFIPEAKDILKKTIQGNSTEAELGVLNNKTFQFKIEPLYDNTNSNIVGMFCVARNISKIKKIEDFLKFKFKKNHD